MNRQINQIFNSLEAQRQQLLGKAKMATNRFNLSPGNDKWSLHQVLAHLVAAEKLSTQYLRKKIQGIDEAQDSGVIENLKMLVLKISLRLPLKFNAPKPVVATTSTYQTFEALQADWDTTRADLKKLLEEIKDDQVNRKIYRHPIVGKLNITQAIEFLGEHVTHHLPQVNRLLK